MAVSAICDTSWVTANAGCIMLCYAIEWTFNEVHDTQPSWHGHLAHTGCTLLLACFADNDGAEWCHTPAVKDFYTDAHVSAPHSVSNACCAGFQ